MIYHSSLIDPPIGFAHRGARLHALENTIEAFTLACRLGASGFESDVWITQDGEAVLDHDGVVRQRLRRRPISTLNLNELPSHIPTLAQLYETCGTKLPLSLDIKDPAAAPVVISVASAAGHEALSNLWLCSPSWEQAGSWRRLSDDIHLIDSTRLKAISEGPERRAAKLADLGIDGINMPYQDWNGGLTTLFHRFQRVAFAWDAHHSHQLHKVLRMGIDAVYSDDVECMVNALAAL